MPRRSKSRLMPANRDPTDCFSLLKTRLAISDYKCAINSLYFIKILININ